MRYAIGFIFVVLVGCADFPALDGAVDDTARNAGFPSLVPLDPLLAKVDQQTATSQITAASVATLDGRIAALRTKAARLRGPIIEPRVRARMRRGVAVPAAIR